MGEWEEKTPEKITFDTPGMEVIGRITDIKPTELKVNSYTLLNDEGDLVSFLGTTVLDRVLSTELNSRVKIVYTGEARTGRGYKVKQFRIFTWKEGAIEEPTEEEHPVKKK